MFCFQIFELQNPPQVKVKVEAYFDFKRFWTVALTSLPHTYSVGRKREVTFHFFSVETRNEKLEIFGKIWKVQKDVKTWAHQRSNEAKEDLWA